MEFDVRHGDGFSLLAEIEDRSLGLLFTDPPWATPASATITRKNKAKGTTAADLTVDHEEFTAEYDWSRLIAEADRTLDVGGHLILWCGWHNVSYLVDECNRVFGFGKTQTIARVVPNPAPRVRGLRLDEASGRKVGGGLISSWDCIIVARRADDDGRRCNLASYHERRNVRVLAETEEGFPDVIEAANPRVKKGLARHPAAKPVALCRELIRNFSAPGDIVCDPCCGGGAILEAALLEGRHAIGSDLKAEWADLAWTRCKTAAGREGSE